MVIFYNNLYSRILLKYSTRNKDKSDTFVDLI